MQKHHNLIGGGNNELCTALLTLLTIQIAIIPIPLDKSCSTDQSERLISDIRFLICVQANLADANCLWPVARFLQHVDDVWKEFLVFHPVWIWTSLTQSNVTSLLWCDEYLTCGHEGTWTTTVGRWDHFLWWTLSPGSLLLVPRCTSWRRLHNNTPSVKQLSSHWSAGRPTAYRAHLDLTLLLVQVTVHVSLHLGVAAVPHPGQVLTGDDGSRLEVEGSGGEGGFHVKVEKHINTN